MLSLYNVTCMYIISELTNWYWIINWEIINKLLGGYSSGKTISPDLRIPVVLCLGLQPHELSHFHLNRSVGVVVQILFRRPCGWCLMNGTSLAFGS